jgi:hypothetical protein
VSIFIQLERGILRMGARCLDHPSEFPHQRSVLEHLSAVTNVLPYLTEMEPPSGSRRRDKWKAKLGFTKASKALLASPASSTSNLVNSAGVELESLEVCELSVFDAEPELIDSFAGPTKMPCILRKPLGSGIQGFAQAGKESCRCL